MNFEQVGYTYQKKTPFEREVLKNITWRIEEPNFIAVTGKTGSGKSTLLAHLNGLLKPTTGIYTHGRVQLQSPYKKGKLGNLRAQIGLVFQFPEKQLFHDMVMEDLCYGPRNFGQSEAVAKENARWALAQVGLDDSFLIRKIDALSGGEKRRVAIAAVLASKPQVLVLDEPGAGLDPQRKKAIFKMLTNLYGQGMTIIVVTHHMDDVLAYAHEMVIMEDGQLVLTGSPTEIFHTVDVEQYGLLKPKIILFKEQIKEDFEIQISVENNQVETVVQEFAQKYRQAGQAGGEM